MFIVQLNCKHRKRVMVSRINRRKETKTGLQVRLGVGNLRLGEGLRRGVAETGKFGASGSPRRVLISFAMYSICS